MIPVARIVEEVVRQSPFVEESLREGLINVSALARKLKPEIEDRTKKEVSDAAIVMAINRMSPGPMITAQRSIERVLQKSGDLIIRSALADYTFKNSDSLLLCLTSFLQGASKDRELFCTYAQGVYETTLIASSAFHDSVMGAFGVEELLAHQKGLASITMRLPPDNIETPGVYYAILKNLAWESITVVEVVSTSYEFTIVVLDSELDKAFSALRKMKGL